MNAKQRRLVRRAFQRFESFDWYIATGGPEDGGPRAYVARHVRALVDLSNGRSNRHRTYRPAGDPEGRRDEAAYGKRCAWKGPGLAGCGRKAHGVSGGLPLCREHVEREIPF